MKERTNEYRSLTRTRFAECADVQNVLGIFGFKQLLILRHRNQIKVEVNLNCKNGSDRK